MKKEKEKMRTIKHLIFIILVVLFFPIIFLMVLFMAFHDAWGMREWE